MALTDEELVELAKKQETSEDEDRHDVGYFQESHNIVSGETSVVIDHLYLYYSKWSIDPIIRDYFVDMLQLSKKDSACVFIDETKCTIDLNKLIGEYVKKEREAQKKERLRKLPSSKSKTQR